MEHHDLSRILGRPADGCGRAGVAGSRPPHWPGRARRRLIFWRVAAAAFVWALALPAIRPLQAAGPPGDPRSVVKAALDGALAILKDRNTALTARRRELHELALKHLDFADMARAALGHHWRELSQEQRKQFVPMFTAFMEDSYLDKIQDYSELQVRYLRQAYHDPGDAEVDTRVTQAGKEEPISLNFYLRREEGGWKVYDVEIDSIRIVANYRNQFNRVINDQGFDALMAQLRRKQAELASLLGK